MISTLIDIEGGVWLEEFGWQGMSKQGIAQIKRNAPLMCIILVDERHGAYVDDMLRWRRAAFNSGHIF